MPRVLLVDDDPAILRLLEVNFRIEGFDVDAAATARRRSRASPPTPPDAVVLDVMLPGMDGHEVFARLRARPATRGRAGRLPDGARRARTTTPVSATSVRT